MSLRNGAHGDFNVTWKVYLPIALSAVTACSDQLLIEAFWRTRSNDHCTSLAVSGVPSEKRTLWRRWKIIVFPPFLNCHEVAISGMILVVSGEMRTSWS